MNLQAIIVANSIGFSMLVMLLISSYLVRQRHSFSDKLFTGMIVLAALACAVEMLSFAIDGLQFPGARALVFLTNSYLYLANVIISYLWCIYVDLRLYQNEKRLQKRYTLLGIPALLSVAVLVANVRWGFIFSVSPENVYHRELVGYSFYAVTLFYLIYSIVLRHTYHGRAGRSRFFPIWIFLVPIFLGSAAQFAFYGVSLAWCSVALGLIGIYMSLQNELSYTDPLTKLYNRNFLDHVIGDLYRHPMSGLMIDIDYFKAINDTYGHVMGDQALVDAALILCWTAPENAIVARFAGDEFIILLRTGQENAAQDLKKKLQQEVEGFNETGLREYILSFSIGCALYRPGEETSDLFLNEMDEQMYVEKRKKHTRSATKV